MMIPNQRSKGQFVKHVACTHPSCNSSDAMAVYLQADGTYDATCFNPDCSHYESDYPYDQVAQGSQSNNGRGEVKQMLTVGQVQACPQLGIESRKLHQPTVEYHGVRSLLNGTDGRTPVAHCFPYYSPTGEIVAFKKRNIEQKYFSIIGDGRDLPFFGQHLYGDGGRRLYITEGEYDAMSLWQVLKDLAGPAYKHLNPCVVSVPNGAASVAKAITNNLKFLDKFEEIVLAFDQDEHGQKAVEQACMVLDSSKVKIAHFSEKDASDMLVAGKENELKWSVLTKAKSYIPSGIATVRDLYDQTIKAPEFGRPWAWPSLTKLTYGRNPGVYLIGAGVGIGKTEFMHEQAGFIVKEERQPVGMFLFEEAPSRTIRILAGKMLDKPAHIPDKPLPQEEYQRGIDLLLEPTNMVYVFDHKWDRDWQSVFTQIKHIVSASGVRDIFIDPLTALISHEENTDRALHGIMDDISTLAADPYNCCVYVSSHLNEPPRDRIPHEEGGRVKESQFAGSRAMIRYANYVFGLERNKQATDPTERNTTTLRILKDREYGQSAGETISIFYDHTTSRYREQTLEF